MMPRSAVFFAAFILISASVTGSAQAKETFFTTYNIQVEGDPIDYKIVDINNDGFRDLIVSSYINKEDSRSRLFSVFYQDDLGFSSSADQTVPVCDNAIIFDIADVAPSPGKEIVCMTNEGLIYHGFEKDVYKSTPELLLKTDSIYKIPDESFLEFFDFIRDTNGDGVEEILIPQFDHYLIYNRSEQGGYTLKSTLSVAMFNKLISSREISPYLVSSYAIPNMVIIDYNKDKRDDIIFVQNKYLQIFYQDENGLFSDTDSAKVNFWMELTQAYSLSLGRRSRFQRNRLKDKTGINSLCDLNNDGLLDIIIETFAFTGSAFNPKKKFYFYYGSLRPGEESRGGFFNKTPDQIIVSRGVHVNSWVQDLNRDGKKDIIIPAVEVGLFKIISMVITGSIDVTAYTYLMDENGSYPQSPNDETTFSMTINRTGRKLPVEDFEGDYNGDGRKDFLGSKGETLFITFGPENGKLVIKDKDVEFDFQIPSNGLNVKPEYVNSDNKSDLVIIYQGIADAQMELQKNVCILMANN